MPRMIDLKKIRSKNPNIDWEAISEWQRVRRILIRQGLRGRHFEDSLLPEGRRARIVDDAAHDSRLIRLQRF